MQKINREPVSRLQCRKERIEVRPISLIMCTSLINSSSQDQEDATVSHAGGNEGNGDEGLTVHSAILVVSETLLSPPPEEVQRTK